MFMRFRAAVPFAALFYLLLPLPAFAQTTLSQTSGINPNDTWATFDMTIETNATVNLSSSYYDPQTQTTTSQIPITPPAQAFHVEVGYDSSGNLVLNAWPTGSTATNSGVSVVRFANGQVTLFDSSGDPIPVQNPNSSVQNYNPLTLLGSNPGSSIIHTLVVPNIETFATNFTSPAFTASASGSAMTGGTN
jgi:hypothetical protein